MKPIICIVEDDAAVRDSLCLMLDLHGYEVEDFVDGEEFLTRGHFEDIAAIVLDLNLPGENGLQILARLRARAVTTPAFVLTGRADSFARRQATRLEVSGLFEKPLAARELIAALAASATTSAPRSA